MDPEKEYPEVVSITPIKKSYGYDGDYWFIGTLKNSHGGSLVYSGGIEYGRDIVSIQEYYHEKQNGLSYVRTKRMLEVSMFSDGRKDGLYFNCYGFRSNCPRDTIYGYFIDNCFIDVYTDTANLENREENTISEDILQKIEPIRKIVYGMYYIVDENGKLRLHTKD